MTATREGMRRGRAIITADAVASAHRHRAGSSMRALHVLSSSAARCALPLPAPLSLRSAASSSLSLRHSHSSSIPPGRSPLDAYDALVSSGEFRLDARQRRTMQMLDAVFHEMVDAISGRRKHTHTTVHPVAAAPAPPQKSSSGGGGFFGFARTLLKSSSASSPAASSAAPSAASSAPTHSPFHSIPGLYLHGGVGCGKTMCMNLFFDCAVATLPGMGERRLTRAHFHSFMLDIHRRLHVLRTTRPDIRGDPLVHIAREMVRSETVLLALDEFQVTDVADAMILRTLFGTLWAEGVVVVATSNRPPEDLYKNGLNRSVFLPFIADLKQRCKVHAMEDGQDHRLLGTIAEGVYQTPLTAATAASMCSAFDRLAGTTDPNQRGPLRIPVMMGRELSVPLASANRNVASFTFSQLCESNVGAADYIALAQTFKYVLLREVPTLYFHEREKIRRFITLLDVLYEHQTRLIIQAANPPASLFQAPTAQMLAENGSNQPQLPQSIADGAAPSFEGVVNGSTPASAVSASPSASAVPASVTATVSDAKYDEQFASSRAISRLIEMSSTQYLQACAKARDSVKPALSPLEEATREEAPTATAAPVAPAAATAKHAPSVKPTEKKREPSPQRMQRQSAAA